MPTKKNASSLISELKRKTRRTYSSEEKIRIIIDGMRGEITIVIFPFLFIRFYNLSILFILK